MDTIPFTLIEGSKSDDRWKPANTTLSISIYSVI